MYVRMGGGLNIAGATKKARVGNEKHESRNSWNVLIGLGWNMSSYVRTEIAFQESSFGFKGIDARADYHTLNGMLYFDFARRYVHHGDITYRRTFVPFMGIGAGIGEYEFAVFDFAGLAFDIIAEGFTGCYRMSVPAYLQSVKIYKAVIPLYLITIFVKSAVL